MAARIAVMVACWLAVASLTDASVKLGDLVTPCSLKDPKLDACLTTMGMKMLPIAIAGNKEWDGIPLDPLLIPHMELQNGDGGASVGLGLAMANSSHYGRKGIQLKSIKCNPKTMEFEISSFIPKYTVLGTYDAKGRILLLPLTGHGSANLTFVDVDVKYNFKTKLAEKGKKTFLKLETFKTSFDVANLKTRLDNLFGNKQLSDTMNTFLNDNGKQVFADLKTTTEQLMTDIDRTLLARILARIPVNQMLKDFN